MQRHKHGGDIYSENYKIDFSANVNPLGPPPGVLAAVTKSIDKIRHYPDVTQRTLRSALAAYEALPPEQIIIGNGAAELIFALALGCRPKKALLAVPGFAEYEEALRASGCEVNAYNLKEEHDFLLQEDYLEQITADTDLLFLCNPNNPTGALTAREFLLKVLQRCREKNVLMVVDECFNGFTKWPEANTMKPYLQEYPNLFILKAFTKQYAIPGLRLGYGLCREEEILTKMKGVMQPWNVSVLAEIAGVAALRESVYVADSRRVIQEEKDYLMAALRQLSCQVYEPAANYIFFRGPKNLAKACLKKGFLIRSCSNYRGLSEGYFRIAVRTRAENIQLVSALQEIMQ